jgi:hypothetical protein
VLTTAPRADRVALRVPISYRPAGAEGWFHSRILNISDSGVLFGPTDLDPGTPVEVMFSSPVQIGSIASGKLVCVGEVVRTTETRAAAARFHECRFFLQA